MDEKWYFVENEERKGPISKNDVFKLLQAGKLNSGSFVWKQGLDNWKRVSDLEDFAQKDENLRSLREEKTQPFLSIQNLPLDKALTFDLVEKGSKSIYIKTGLDRGQRAQEFGPFDLDMLKQLYKSKRINGKTLIFFPGLDVWRVLASFEDFEKTFNELPPVISEEDKRAWERKPFTARLFFTNEDKFFEGICKDISLGGMMVLINSFVCQLGDVISLNVHPDQEEYQFVTKAKVVRILDNNTGFSLQFVDLSPEATSAIKSFLANG